MNSKIITSGLLSQDNRIISGFTARNPGSDYQKISSLLKVDLKSINTLKQVHSNKVTRLVTPIGCELADGDALVTTQKNVVIGVRVADCLPLLVYDPIGGMVAAVHAGWRGVVSGIIENSLSMMKTCGSIPKNCLVSMGPCICDKCFEVGPEVVCEFKNKFADGSEIIVSGKGDRSFIYLKHAARIILLAAGIPEIQIEINGWCTRCHNDVWPSYRGGDVTLRTLAYIALKGQ